MPDLIDRQSLGVGKCNPDVFNDAEYAKGWNALMCIIDGAQTVDAAPVVQGGWILTRLDNFRKYECKCSNCGWAGIENYDSYVDPTDFTYCPNCGAHMTREDKP